MSWNCPSCSSENTDDTSLRCYCGLDRTTDDQDTEKEDVSINQHYSFCPDKEYFRELIRPWKIFTFCIAMSGLLYGALNYEIGDWDVGITVIMGVLTYLLAPWSVYIIWSAVRHRPKLWCLHVAAALIAALFVVDWVYMLYHTTVGNQIFREANFYASTPIYFLGGITWVYRGSFKELLANIVKPN